MDYEHVDLAKHAKAKDERHAAFLEKWRKIKMNKTPYLFPKTFKVRAFKGTPDLRLILPDPSGFCLGINVKLNVKAVEAKGELTYGMERNRTDTVRELLWIRFDIALRDGWTDSQGNENSVDWTVIKVKKLK